jgi:hypothetical protein
MTRRLDRDLWLFLWTTVNFQPDKADSMATTNSRSPRKKPKAPRKPRSENERIPLLGAHMSIAGGPAKAIERGRSIGCSAIQIFVKNNMQWFAKPFTETELAAYQNYPDRPKLVFGQSRSEESGISGKVNPLTDGGID